MSHKELATVLDAYKESSLGFSSSRPNIKVELVERDKNNKIET